jgi:hypothetical protein
MKGRRGFFDLDLVGLVKLIPPGARLAVAATLMVCALAFLGWRVTQLAVALEHHRDDHKAELAQLTQHLDKIGSGVSDIQQRLPAIAVEADYAKAQADRANARLDGAETDPAYAGAVAKIGH